MTDRTLLARAAELAADHLDSIAERHAGALAGAAELRDALGGGLPDAGVPADRVIEELARDAAPGLVASPGPRYFGFVVGGAVPAALAADWLAAAWDQNAFSAVSSPAAAVVEEVAGAWLLELLGLPADAGVGLTTGAQGANVTGLAAARGALLAREGWDVEEQGLAGSPPLRVLLGGEAHITVWRALRLLGIGRAAVEVVAGDGQGRMDAPALAAALAAGRRAGTGGPRRRGRAGARRSCGRGGAASTRGRWPRWRRWGRGHASMTRGSTSTAPWGCGRPPLPRSPRSRPARRTRTRGRRTRTSGSTSPTTAASSPSATPPRTPPPWA